MVGGFTFKSNPNNLNFSVRVENDYPGQGDSYFIKSTDNLSLSNNVEVGDIFWRLDAYSSVSPLYNTELPTNAPVLSNWNENNYMLISGGIDGSYPCWNKSFYIQAEVFSAILIPEPISIILFGFGLLALRKQK
jgi:hypothetical protein